MTPRAKKSEPESETDPYHPRLATQLIGHESIIDAINPKDGARKHHSFIFSGAKGIGKATAAYALARRIFDAQDAPLIAAASHPDLLVLEPAPDRATKTITIEQIRKTGAFLGQTPARGKWRMVIVDSLDAMNWAGANAMLKTLEEPPAHAIIVLVNHRTRPILPTVRSRCRMVGFATLDFDSTRAVAQKMFAEADTDWLNAATMLAAGAPGKVALFAEAGAPDLYAASCDAIAGDASLTDLENIATDWGAGGAANLARRQTAVLVFDRLLTLAVRNAAAGDKSPHLECESRAIASMTARFDAASLGEIHQQLIRDLHDAENLNTDQSVIIFNFLQKFC